jgi:hypothetical protein
MSEGDHIPAPAEVLAKKTPRQSVLTKKRYHDIQAALCNMLTGLNLDEEVRQQTVAATMSQIREIMKFDPDAKTYTPELGKKILSYRKKKAAEAGVSMYEVFKGHEYYEKNKEVLNKNNAEYKRNRKDGSKESSRV